MGEQHEKFVPSSQGAYEALDYLRKTCQYYRNQMHVDTEIKHPCSVCVLRGHGSKKCIFETLYSDEDWTGYVSNWPLVKPDAPPSLLGYTAD